MAFMTLDVILFRKKIKSVIYFASFFVFVYLLPSLIKERPHTTLSVSEEGAIKHIFGVTKYGFTSSKAFCGKF